MEIKELFKELERQTKGKEMIFYNSGMFDLQQQLKFGFFPLGSGVLLNKEKSLIKNATVKEGGYLFLGNDFGTICDYLKNNAITLTEGESGNKTVAKILRFFENNGIKEKLNCSFFTNLHLGLRIVGTQTKRKVNLENEYIALCKVFFEATIEYINPKLIIVLGKETMESLKEMYNTLPEKWAKNKKATFEQLAENRNDYITEINLHNNRTLKLICAHHFSMLDTNKNKGRAIYDNFLNELRN